MASDIKDKIRQSLHEIPDFPMAGITFYDITTVLKNGQLFKEIIAELASRYQGKEIDAIMGIESRGFIFACPLAQQLGIGFIPIRKPGKLPAEVESITYDTEYSSDTLELHKDSLKQGDKVLIVDDLLATGGSASAAISLVKSLGAKVLECAFLIELVNLEGRNKLNDTPVFSFLECEG